MAGFNDPIAGSLGALLIQQIMSPNFSLSGKTGWAILKNGDAYFFNITATGDIIASQVIVGASPNPQVIIDVVGSAGVLDMPTNAALEAASANVFSETVGSGGSEYLALAIFGPEATSQADRVIILLTSAQDTPAGPASIQLIYDDTTGADHTYASCGAQGFQIAAGSIVGVEPGTGTVATPAVAESWHTATLVNGWGGSGSGVNGLRYQRVAFGSGTAVWVQADITNASTGSSICFTLPAGYRPAKDMNFECMWNNPQASNSTTTPWVFVDTGGDIQVTAYQTANKEVFFNLFIPLD